MAFEFKGTVVMPSEEFFSFLCSDPAVRDSDTAYVLERSYISNDSRELVLMPSKEGEPAYHLGLEVLWMEISRYHPDFSEATFYGVPYLLSGDLAVDMVASTESFEGLKRGLGAPLEAQWNRPSQHQGEGVFFLSRNPSSFSSGIVDSKEVEAFLNSGFEVIPTSGGAGEIGFKLRKRLIVDQMPYVNAHVRDDDCIFDHTECDVELYEDGRLVLSMPSADYAEEYDYQDDKSGWLALGADAGVSEFK